MSFIHRMIITPSILRRYKAMVFNSYVFVLLFLPAGLAIYYLLCPRLPRALSQIVLIALCGIFCLCSGFEALAALGISVLFNYALSRLICSEKPAQTMRKLILFFGIAVNVIALLYCKYLNLFIDTVNLILVREYPLKSLILPLGISYYSFQQIAYLVDAYRHETQDDGFLEYVLFCVWFPKIAQGPIVLREEMLSEFRDERNRHFNGENFAAGLYRFGVGIFKKVLVADVIACFVNKGYADVKSLSSPEAILLVAAFTLQLYYDFSGYCDMACGISEMFNIKLPENFRSPLKSLSLTDFWARWHITLTRFLRKYIYFPLGGNRKGKIRTYLNILVIFTVSGLWHGANMTFVVWGLLHGIFNCLERRFAVCRSRLPKAVQWLLTFWTVAVLFSIFRADSLREAGILLSRIFVGGSGFDFARYAGAFNVTLLLSAENALSFGRLPAELLTVFNTILYFAVSMSAILFGKNAFESSRELNGKKAVLTGLMLAVSVLSLSNVSAFLYAQF